MEKQIEIKNCETPTLQEIKLARRQGNYFITQSNYRRTILFLAWFKEPTEDSYDVALFKVRLK